MPPKGTPQPTERQVPLFETEKGGRFTRLHGEQAVQVGSTVVPVSEFKRQLTASKEDRATQHSP